MFYLALIAPLLIASFPVPVPTITADNIEKVETRNMPRTVACNCVAFARTKRPDLPGMDARNYRISTTTPFIGAIAKMYYPHSGLYHLAYVIDFGDNWVELIDANYKTCQVTHRRVMLPDRILGYL